MSDWFKKWFSSDEYLSVYSHRNIEDAENLLNLILNNISIPQNANILDAACGAGRHSILLAQRGYNVTAFDLSRNLLNIGKDNAATSGVHLELFCGDIRNICLNGSFNLVLNMFTSFGYFESDNENFRFFNLAKSILKNDGYLVLDYINAFSLKKNLVSESEKKIDDKIIIEKRKIIDSFVRKDIEIKYDGTTKIFNETVKLYSLEEIKRKCEEIGFSIHKVFGNYHGDPFSESDSERLIIIFTL